MMADNQEQATIDTYDRNAAQWSKSHISADIWVDAEAHFHRLLPSGTVLEIGCGGGRDARALIASGYDYVGTDASSGMVEVARQVAPTGIFKQLNVYDLPELRQRFDGIWACAVLLHIPKQRIDSALAAINKSLRLNGIGMISMKDGDKEDFEVRDKGSMHEECLFAYWRKDDFSTALVRNGFKIIDYKYHPVSERTKWHIFFITKVAELT